MQPWYERCAACMKPEWYEAWGIRYEVRGVWYVACSDNLPDRDSSPVQNTRLCQTSTIPSACNTVPQDPSRCLGAIVRISNPSPHARAFLLLLLLLLLLLHLHRVKAKGRRSTCVREGTVHQIPTGLRRYGATVLRCYGASGGRRKPEATRRPALFCSRTRVLPRFASHLGAALVLCVL
ncbi:hypothetical protein K431DRAFT_91661 [Polychaeton citri CBS 116435]|uniref:Uncharacterized protein n=1 Tax=Polychaeton citri CBS 116435 TaxID=1314669 RepID=A0A9P4UPX1_9PEZI|nr:hypothetical protein K431DRAFT_91661 [Polychaeton citri CBS 116435]